MPNCGTQNCIVKAPAGTFQALGFSSIVAGDCCVLPCPALPIHSVTICVRINSCTQLKIQQGCAVPAATEDCEAYYSWGQTYDSWGRKCRVVTWQRQVPDDAYVRLRFCPVADDCYTGCICDTGVQNALIRLEIDGSDVLRTVDAVNRYPYGQYACIRAACIGSTDAVTTDETACCRIGTGGVVNWHIDNIPIGAEIVVGPMNEVPYSYPPAVLA